MDFKPSEARGGKREKFEPRGETGIFAGYVLSTGMHWANKYRAWALTAFAGAELNIKKAKVPPRLRMPHQTERMILKSPLTFPIQQKYKQDLGNSPASFEASRWADFLGCHDGWDVQMADAVQAYIQATLRGTPCWIELPPEAVPSECRWDKYRRPVVPLRKALYGRWF